MSEAKINQNVHISSVRPRITIAVACFKQEEFLFECLNSLVAQTMPAWEAFVVDDCSPKRIVDRIVAGYKDPRIRSIRHDFNRGAGPSRNTAIQTGHAPFVVYVDADDFVHREFLVATLDAIERRGADCAYSDFQCVGLSNDVWRPEPKSANELAEAQWIPGPGTVMRRSVWERVGGYGGANLYPNEDWDFWIGAVAAGFSVVHVPRLLYFYRRHAESGMATMARNEWISREAIIKRHAEFFAVGDRAKRFRAGGLLSSAYANRAAGYRWQWAALTARAISVDRRLIYREIKAVARALTRKAKRIITSIIASNGKMYSNWDQNAKQLPARDWDSLAPALHNRYGYLSHDFSVLGQVLHKTEAHSVLEVGCGSGRLVPVYLAHNVQTILLQDMSAQALDLCRQRFFCQEQIRYFHGNMQRIPISVSPDLIVANRVLQHILDDAEFADMLAHLAAMTRFFYINEIGIDEAIRRGDPNVRGRDYAGVFRDLGWRIADWGELTAEHGTRQSWLLFTKDQKRAARKVPRPCI
jgi:glycosyltransferase involved in cell wall biosynthesis